MSRSKEERDWSRDYVYWSASCWVRGSKPAKSWWRAWQSKSSSVKGRYCWRADLTFKWSIVIIRVESWRARDWRMSLAFGM